MRAILQSKKCSAKVDSARFDRHEQIQQQWTRIRSTQSNTCKSVFSERSLARLVCFPDEPTSCRSPTIHKRSRKSFSRGAADLCIEARILSLLRHANIIKLHHVSSGNIRENFNCPEANAANPQQSCCNGGLRRMGYFLVLDFLHETLRHRIASRYIPEYKLLSGEDPRAQHENHRCTTGQHMGSFHRAAAHERQRQWWGLPWVHLKRTDRVSSCPVSTQSAFRESLAERLRVLRAIASAVDYLHKKRIVFRGKNCDAPCVS